MGEFQDTKLITVRNANPKIGCLSLRHVFATAYSANHLTDFNQDISWHGSYKLERCSLDREALVTRCHSMTEPKVLILSIALQRSGRVFTLNVGSLGFLALIYGVCIHWIHEQCTSVAIPFLFRTVCELYCRNFLSTPFKRNVAFPVSTFSPRNPYFV